MYVKLVCSTAAYAQACMRDIGRLITATTPSLSMLGGFSQTSSVIIDATPAGWTYVGSNFAADQPTIGATGAALNSTINVYPNLCFSAPCLSGSALKYVALTTTWGAMPGNATNGGYFALTAAQSATSLGVMTNEGPRGYSASGTVITYAAGVSITGNAAAAVLHLIATPRHITIIQEGRGLSGVWESTMTDAHTFYNMAPVIQYCHSDSTVRTTNSWIIPTVAVAAGAASIACIGLTDPNTGTVYGTYGPTRTGTTNLGNLLQNTANRTNTCDANGAPKYQIGPVFYSCDAIGYPTQFVTGVVPIYWTASTLGNSGDNVDVNGDTYTLFYAGTGFGVIMKTS